MSGKQKVGFSREKHFTLGSQLAAMEAVLHRAVLDASHAYSVTGREVGALERACRAIERARSVLDDAICRERPLSDVGVIDAYYPRQAPGTPSVERAVPPVPPGQNRWDRNKLFVSMD